MGRSSNDNNDKKDKKSKKEKKKSSHKKSSDKKHKKKHHHKHRDDDEKKTSSSRRSSSNRKNHLLKPVVSLGEPLGQAPLRLLDAEKDYFAFHEHFWVYLYRNEQTVFNDLTSDESHTAFARFVSEYNAGRLESAYYQDKLPVEAMEEIQTTKHSWKFRISTAEDESLRTLSMGIRSQTEYREGTNNGYNDNQAQSVQYPSHQSATATATAPTSKDDVPFPTSDSKRSNDERYQDRLVNKRLKTHVQTTMDELTGGRADYGRERQLEKRQQVANRTHGAARERDEQGVELNDNAIFGNDDDDKSFQSALQRRQQQAAQRVFKQQSRLEELQQKEEQKKNDMLIKLGIQPGQTKKIVIQPRND
jgi:hypothetical protein